MGETGIYGDYAVGFLGEDVAVFSVVEDELVLRRLDGQGTVLQEEVLWQGSKIQELSVYSQENIHLTWHEQVGAVYSLHYAYLEEGKPFVHEVVLESSTRILHPKVTVLHDQVHFLWVEAFQQAFQVHHLTRDKRQPVAITRNTSVSPSVVGDSEGNLHAVWFEVGPSGVEVVHARYVGEVWSEVTVIGKGALRDIENKGNIALLYHGGILHVLWTTFRISGLSLQGTSHLLWGRLDEKGQHLYPVEEVGEGRRPELVFQEGLHLVWQDFRQGALNVFFRSLEEEPGEILLLSVSRQSAFHPQIFADLQGFLWVVWLEAKTLGFSLVAMNNRYEREETLLYRLGIDEEAPFLHFFFLVSGALMLTISYVGMNMGVFGLTLFFMFLLLGHKSFRKRALAYHVVLATALFLVFQETPLSLIRVDYFGVWMKILPVGLAALFTFLFLRKHDMELGFYQGVLVGTLFFWYTFFALVPQALIALWS